MPHCFVFLAWGWDDMKTQQASESRLWPHLLPWRGWVQLVAAVIANNGLTQRWTKGIPCLGFNCYACPLAAVACPIGSLQHFVGQHAVPWYVLGLIGLVGALGGRFACGWLCPFGWLQDLLYRIPLPKWAVRPHRPISWWLIGAISLGYLAGLWATITSAGEFPLVLALYLLGGLALYVYLGQGRMFALVGIVLITAWLTAEPWFCKLCPAGTLEGGIPQVLLHSELSRMIGPLFWLKIALLIVFLIGAAVIHRPFCRWFCPLGACWSLFNRWSTLQMTVASTCIHCGRCQQVCPVDIRIDQNPCSPDCIRCMQCVSACPVSCIHIQAR